MSALLNWRPCSLLVTVPGVYASRPESDRAMLFGVLTDTIRYPAYGILAAPQPKRVSLTTLKGSFSTWVILFTLALSRCSLQFITHLAPCDLQADHYYMDKRLAFPSSIGVGKRGTSNSQGHRASHIEEAETHRSRHVIKGSLPSFVLVSFLHLGRYHGSDRWRSGSSSALIVFA